MDAVVDFAPKSKKVTGGMWDATRERWIDPRWATPENLKQMHEEGYVFLRLDHDFPLPDGRDVRNVLVKKGDLSVQTIPCELGPEWKEFEEELGNFKSEYVKTRAQLTVNLAALNEKREEMSVLRMMIENVNSQDLKEKLENILDKYESDEGIPALTQQCGELQGRLEAMKKVLLDTGAGRYGKFTCFVCMDLS